MGDQEVVGNLSGGTKMGSLSGGRGGGEFELWNQHVVMAITFHSAQNFKNDQF